MISIQRTSEGSKISTGTVPTRGVRNEVPIELEYGMVLQPSCDVFAWLPVVGVKWAAWGLGKVCSM